LAEKFPRDLSEAFFLQFWQIYLRPFEIFLAIQKIHHHQLTKAPCFEIVEKLICWTTMRESDATRVWLREGREKNLRVYV
jgi:hypothetical protein